MQRKLSQVAMVKPVLEGPPSILNRPDGSVLFECMCNSQPPPEVKWFFKVGHLCRVQQCVGSQRQFGTFASRTNTVV